MLAFFEWPVDAKARLRTSCCRNAADEARNGRYAGWGSDSGREWLQLRLEQPAARPRQAGAPRAIPAGAPAAFELAFMHLRRASALC
eukprot:5423926-Prymnesium_polylepis.1